MFHIIIAEQPCVVIDFIGVSIILKDDIKIYEQHSIRLPSMECWVNSVLFYCLCECSEFNRSNSHIINLSHSCHFLHGRESDMVVPSYSISCKSFRESETFQIPLYNRWDVQIEKENTLWHKGRIRGWKCECNTV